ncbi:CHAT domain-containing protein [Streptomyces sp. NBC_01343]|uniref:CHAT domain-containing protein n=1 Tax=Streptomyces sp. NBC_01343 TaxID=2903832 RepID=UPI002E0FCD21|nr:CHAT domain-containing protein [Streptomyces sp. NBC_01343]
MDESLRRARDLWSRARELLDLRTETALREAVGILTSVLDLVPATGLRALIHHDVGIGHGRLAKLGHPEHAPLAVDHALQACGTDVGYVLVKGSTEDLERDMGLLADMVRLTGVDLARLREAQAFLDRHRMLFQGLPAHRELQQAVAEGHLVLMEVLVETAPVTQELCDAARGAFERTLHLLAGAGQPGPDRLAVTLANRSFAELLAARGMAGFHAALDHVFAAEDAHRNGRGDLAGGLSLRARAILCLSRSRYSELELADRWRLRYRLWERWAGEWVRGLDRPDPDPSLRPPLSDWFGLLVELEADDVSSAMESAGDSVPKGPIPLEVRAYATALIQVGGYPLGLVVVLIGYRLGGRLVPPDELFLPEWADVARDPAQMYAMAGFFGDIRGTITAGQRGSDSALPDLMSRFASLPQEQAPQAAPYFFWACMELTSGTGLTGRWGELMTFMYDLAQHVPESDRLLLMSEGWPTFAHVALSVEHHRAARRWTRELVRLAEDARRAGPSDSAAYFVLRTRLQEAKVRAVIEGDDMDGVVADLARRIEEHRAVDGASAVSLDVDLHRLRAQVAIECGDRDGVIARFADCVRLASAHPELDLGRGPVDAVNLINASCQVGLVTVRPFAREVVTAARVLLDDLPGVLGLGEPGVSALAALTRNPVSDVADLDDEQVRLVTATVRARRTGERPASGPRPTTRLGPGERSLAETLESCAHHHERGEAEEAVLTLLEWLMVNAGQPVHEFRARAHQCAVALVLEEYVRTSDKFSEPIRMVARYVAGESARHAGMREVARQHLSRAYEEARSTPEPPIPVDAVECDYAILMIVSAVGDGDRPEALRWLRVLFDNPLARSPLGAAHLAQAVILTLEMCGPDELARETAIAVQALSDAAALDRHPDPANALRMTVCRTELLIATGDTTSLPALLPVLVGLARGAPPALEALVRRTLVGALAALGDLDGIRAELDRLTFLQDEAIGSTVRFDALPQVDHFLRAQLVAAAAAADAQDVGSAVEVIEQGRLRLLRRLRAGIEGVEGPQALPSHLESTGLWGVLAAVAVEEPATAFGVAVEDWRHVFHDVDADAAMEAADRVGVVAYQFVHDDRLRVLYLIHGRSAFTVGPLNVRGLKLFDEDNEELLLALGGSWASAMATCVARGVAPQDLRPILICAGERSELAVLNDLAFGAVTRFEPGEPRLLNHLPSVRFARPRETDEPAPAGPVRLLHIGDASNTLLGPWLEAAALRETDGLEVLSLLGADSTEANFRRHLPDVSVIVASCHGAQGEGGLLGSSLMVGTAGLSVLDIAARHSLAHIDMLFLASCEMGRRFDRHQERESVSFSNAALVSGCRRVVAPILPVNDLLSAVLVDEFCRRLPVDGSLLAYQGASAAVRAMPGTDLMDRVDAMWTRLRGSPLAELMPWPVKSAARVLERSAARAFAPGVRPPTFCISENGT